MNWLYQYFIGNIDNSIDYCKKSEKKNEIFQRRNDERFKVDNSYIYDGKEKIGHWIDDYDKLLDIANEQHETIIDNEEYIKDLEYQLKGFKKDYNDCGEYLKEYQQKVKDTLQWIYNDSKVINSKERQKAVKLIAKELGIDLQ